PVVDVDRDGPDLEAGQHRLEVLGAVLEVEADVAAGPHSEPPQMVGEPVGPLLELAVGASLLAAHERLAVPARVGRHLPDVGEVEAPRWRDRGHGVPPGLVAGLVGDRSSWGGPGPARAVRRWRPGSSG